MAAFQRRQRPVGILAAERAIPARGVEFGHNIRGVHRFCLPYSRASTRSLMKLVSRRARNAPAATAGS